MSALSFDERARVIRSWANRLEKRLRDVVAGRPNEADSRRVVDPQVLDIAERGRSLGVVLFGAEQFLSSVHERATGNCSTTVIGRSGSAELADRAYRFLDPAVKTNITRLQKGELVISHATFRQPVKIRFPRPAYPQEGVE